MKPAEKTAGPIVFVVDDDASVREALSSLIRSIGLRIEAFAFRKGIPCAGRASSRREIRTNRREAIPAAESGGSARVPRARRAPAGVERTGSPARAG